MRSLAVAGVLLVGVGIGATVEAANQEPEVVTEIKEVKVPVEIYKTDLKTVTVEAPAPEVPPLPESCRTALDLAARVAELSGDYSSRSGAMVQYMSDLAAQVHLADIPDDLDDMHRRLLRMREDERGSLRDMGQTQNLLEKSTEECKADG